MARSVECKCDARFTCGYCCRNAKPYIFTPSTVAEQAARPLKTAAELGLTEQELAAQVAITEEIVAEVIAEEQIEDEADDDSRNPGPWSIL
jgi:hypothetical protein